MKPNSTPKTITRTRRWLSTIPFTLLAFAFIGTAGAASKYWDPSISGGPSDGTGTWNAALTNWWSGTADVVWAANDIAIIGTAAGTAGTITLGSPITCGGLTFNTTATGNYTITGNTLTFSGPATTYNEFIAYQPATICSAISATTPLVFTKGTVTLNGGTVSAAQNFNVGPVGSVQGNAAVKITGGASTFGELLVGRGSGFAGALYVSGGTTTFGGGGGSGVGVGSGNTFNGEPNADGTSFGYMEVSAGTVSCSEWNIGNRDRGVMYVNGGTVNNNGNIWSTNVGARNGGAGVLDISSGTWNQNNSVNGINAVEITLANSVLNVRGGTLNIMVNKSVNITSPGVLNVSNGGLIQTVPSIIGTGALNFDNGTVQARGDNSAFLANSGGIYLNAGGATIDTQDFNIGIAKNILAPPGNGVTGLDASTPFTTISNMVAAPMVVITGGGGAGATAITNFNSATGQVTGITITNPGRNYTSAPSFTLYAGGAALATTYLGTYAANSTNGGLIKKGTGTLTLSGTANTYTGETRVQAGTLKIGGDHAVANGKTSGITLSNATKLDLTSSLTVKTLTAGESASDSMQLNLVAGTTARNITLSNSGGLNAVAGSGKIVLSVGNGGGWEIGTKYPLITYTGSITGSFSSFALTTVSAAYGVLVDDAGVVNFQVTALPASGPFTWTGATDGNWNLDLATKNWKDGSSVATPYGNGNAVTFNDSASLFNVVLTDTITPTSMTVDNSINAYTFSGTGKLSGTMSLTKTGIGTLTLGNLTASDYSGGTNLNNGTLKLASTTALPAAGAVTFGGGTLDMNGFSSTVGTLSGTSGSSIINSSTTASTLTTSETGTQTFSGTINCGANTLNLVVLGTGTLVISSTGNTASALMPGNNSASATVTLNDSVVSNPALTLASGINRFRNAGGTSTTPARFNMTAGTLTLNSDFRLSQDGGHSIATITGGTVNHTANNLQVSYNAGMAVFNLGGTAIYNGSGRTLDMANASNCNAYANFYGTTSAATFGAINIATSNGSGAGQYGMINVSDTASLTGTSMQVGVSQSLNNSTYRGVATVNQDGGTVTINGNVSLAVAAPAAYPLSLLGSYNLYGGILKAKKIATGTTPGTSRLNFHGGTLTYNDTLAQTDFIALGTNGAAYIYEGASIDTAGQNVTVNQALLAPTGSGVTSIPFTAAGTNQFVPGAVKIVRNAADTTGVGATATAVVDPGTGAMTNIRITNPGTGYTVAPTVTLDRGEGTAATLGTVTIGANNYSGGLTKKGTGKLTLTSNANSYTGPTVVEAGTLALGSTGSIDNTSRISIAAGATLDVSAKTSPYALPGSALSASGATASPSTIKGPASGSVSLGALPVSLAYNGTDPALTVSQAALVLGGNTFTIVASATPLNMGVYTLVDVPNGITGTVNATPTYSGTVVATGFTGTVAISSDGKSVVLNVNFKPYGDWAFNRGLTGVAGDGTDRDPAPTADPDKDGATNLIEFAFNGNPRDGSDNGKVYSLTEVASDYSADKVLILTIAVRAGTTFGADPAVQLHNAVAVDGLTYTIEGTTNLNTFDVEQVWPNTLSGNPVVHLPVGVSTDPGEGYEFHSFTLVGSDNPATLPKGFLRAKVEMNP